MKKPLQLAHNCQLADLFKDVMLLRQLEGQRRLQLCMGGVLVAQLLHQVPPHLLGQVLQTREPPKAVHVNTPRSGGKECMKQRNKYSNSQSRQKGK